MKIKYLVTPALYAEMRKNNELANPSICDTDYKRFSDGDMCTRYYGLNKEKEKDCHIFCEIAIYDDIKDIFLVLMPSYFPFVSDVIETQLNKRNL